MTDNEQANENRLRRMQAELRMLEAKRKVIAALEGLTIAEARKVLWDGVHQELDYYFTVDKKAIAGVNAAIDASVLWVTASSGASQRCDSTEKAVTQ